MKPKGFTLIELLIVIATIGILASIVYPFLAKLAGVNVVPATSSGQTVGGLSCQNGVLFSIDSNGNARPATDAEGNASRC